MELVQRTSNSQNTQRAVIADFNSRGWILVRISRALRSYTDLTFRCQG